MQPDAGLPTFYMWTFPPPYESLHKVLTSDQQPSASDTLGYMYETTRLHILQESSHLNDRLEDSLISSRGLADVSKLRRLRTIFYVVF